MSEKNKDAAITEVSQSPTKAESFVSKNKKVLNYAIGGVVAIVLGVVLYNMYYLKPREQEAENLMYKIEDLFTKDSMKQVMAGDAKLDIMSVVDFEDQYRGTPAGQRAAFIIGRQYMDEKKYPEAIEYLERFELKDLTVYPSALSLIGDCHVEQKEYDEAIAAYKKAFAAGSKNDAIAPGILFKLATVQEELGMFADAENTYKRIKEDYKEDVLAGTIDKYIARAKLRNESKAQ